jgi:peroxiredoxin Q/BCP
MVLEANTKAPEFSAQAFIEREEKTISLSDYAGKRVVLYFYPKDMTPGCTIQAENLRDHMTKFKENDIVVIGVSPDSIEKHNAFVGKKQLNFILVSDEEKTLANLYDVWGEKKFMGKTYDGINRTTYILDEEQNIFHVFDSPKVKMHSEEIFKLLKIKLPAK